MKTIDELRDAASATRMERIGWRSEHWHTELCRQKDKGVPVVRAQDVKWGIGLVHPKSEEIYYGYLSAGHRCWENKGSVNMTYGYPLGSRFVTLHYVNRKGSETFEGTTRVGDTIATYQILPEAV